MSYNAKILLLTCVLFFLIIISLIWWFEYKILFFPSQDINWFPQIPFKQIFLGLDSKPIGVYESKEMLPQVSDGSSEFVASSMSSEPNTSWTRIPANVLEKLKLKPIQDKISVWYFNFSGKEDDKTILFCHGNNANISYRKYVIDLCNFLSVNLFLFDYRGYGKSTGIPSPGSICADGMIAYNYLRTFCSPQNIYLWGESLGGAAAVHIASQAVCARLIYMCTFSSLDDIVVTKQSVQRWIGIALSTVVKTICDVLPSSTKISGVTCPIVVIHSTDDEIIPFECALKLYSSISHDDKLFLKIRGEHSSPEITQEQMFDLVRFCGFSQNVRKSQNGFLEDWLDKLKNNVFEQV